MTANMAPLSFRSAVFIVLVILASSVLMLAGLVVLVDPDQVFHRSQSWLPAHRFRNEPWVQNAGLINSYLADPGLSFDTVMIGSSVSQNFQPAQLDGRGGHGKVMKLALSGAGPMAQKMVLIRALATGRVKHVYGEILSTQYSVIDDTGRNRGASTYKRGDYGYDAAYLYNASRFDDYGYVFNIHSLLAAVALLLGRDVEYVLPMDQIGNWATDCAQDVDCADGINLAPGAVERFRNFYVPHNFDYQQLLVAYDTGMYGLVDAALLDVVLAYCDSSVGFDLHFPPVSLMTYAGMSDRDFGYHFFMLRYVLEQVGHCNNVRIFAFGDDGRLTGNMANYSDVVHFMPWVSDYVAQSFINGNHRITRENIESYELTMIAVINDYIPYSVSRE